MKTGIFKPLIVVSILLVSWCHAAKYTYLTKEKSLYWACFDALSPYKFTNDVGRVYAPNCQPTQNRFLSWVICNFENQEPENLNKTLELVIKRCELSKPFVNHTVEDLYGIYEKAIPTAIDVENNPSFNASVSLTSPIIAPKKKVQRFARAYYGRAKSQRHSKLYGGAIFIYFAGCLLIGGIVTWSKRLCPKLIQKLVGPKVNMFRRMFTMPPVNSKHTQILKWKKLILGIIPTRAQTYVLFGYFALNIILSCVGYDIFTDNFFTARKHQVASQTADLVQYRTGVIAIIHTPAVFLMSGRNNLLLYLTGWSYETFLVYHKWLARGMWIHALVHSSCYTWLEIDYLADFWEYEYWRWGVAATISGAFLLFFASGYFRIRWYETFKTIHVWLSALYIAGLWLHLRKFDGLWMEYVYSAIGVWSADHFFRLCRLLWFGIFTKAECQLFQDDQTIKIKVPRPSSWKPFPGAFVYIYFMRPYGFWQSHPFTILAHDNDSDGKYIYMYVKVKGGLTKSLANALNNTSSKKKSIYVLVEGPYGFEAPMKNYSNSLIITGGNGVPTGFSTYDALTKPLRESSTDTVKWIWIIRDTSPLKWFEQELLGLEDRLGEIDIYVTQSQQISEFEPLTSESASTSSSAGKNDSENKIEVEGSSHDFTKPLARFPKIKFYFGRPNLDTLLVEELQSATGSTAILCCGPGKMNDEVRKIVANNLNSTASRVDYFEDAQIW
ncbi:unnamed protein product [Kluyveromyces dobzhanskii CBS 2104]|uniref:ferric-chelate reductase (NADPH) n=1 Tax=Kluyveromyces dobzhanskii CBS 2104 TaxID=1427455 RepID=A0A0A8LDU5_9SACH|nr:unnamed protein product [Kluyveromyces dobzhanskii CBS 2104]